MIDWRSFCFALAFVTLCFLCIPIKIDNLKEVEKRMVFNSYMQIFNKSYSLESNEYEDRFKNFENAIKLCEQLNKKRNSSELAYYGFTQFTDISTDEFKLQYLKHHSHHKRNHSSRRRPHNHNIELNKTNNLLKLTPGSDPLPKTVDWRKRGIISAIKNQELCGACWAFSTISVAESMFALKTGKLQDLSVQEAIDCARNGNQGCSGGDTCSLLEWLVSNNVKIETENEYPLVLKNGVCKLKSANIIDGVQIAPNYLCIDFVNDENQLLSVIANHGPVTVAVNALSWQYYLGGVIKYNCDGNPQNLNHAVVIVGYDLTASIPYYIVRNSWGTNFGERGYLKIAIGDNICGIANEVAIFDVL